jgi:hypothetical protein
MDTEVLKQLANNLKSNKGFKESIEEKSQLNDDSSEVMDGFKNLVEEVESEKQKENKAIEANEQVEPKEEKKEKRPRKSEIKAVEASAEEVENNNDSKTAVVEDESIKKEEKGETNKKKFSWFDTEKQAEVIEKNVELPIEVKSKLSLLEELLNNPVVKLAYESQNKGEDFMNKLLDINSLNPKNLSITEKYAEGLRRDGATSEEIAEALEDFGMLKGYEQKEKVKEIDRMLLNEYNEKLNAINIQPKPYVDPNKLKEEFIKETNSIIDKIKGMEMYGIEMNEQELKKFKQEAIKPLWDLDESGKPNMEDYLDVVWKVNNFDRMLEQAKKIGFEEGIIFKKDTDSHSGTVLKKSIGNQLNKASSTGEIGSLEYHLKNAPNLKQFFNS